MPNINHELLIHNILSKITLPKNWLSDITSNNLKNQYSITFYKMGTHEYYFRVVEKQLIITAGNLHLFYFIKKFYVIYLLFI